MNINKQGTLLLLLSSICFAKVSGQSDTLRLSKGPIVDQDLRTEDRFPDDSGIIYTKVLWITKLSDKSKPKAPVIFKSNVLIENSSKCYDLFSGKPMNLESDSSKRVFGGSFIQIPSMESAKLYCQGTVIGTYRGGAFKITANDSKRGFSFGDYKVKCVDSNGDEIWSMEHPERRASGVWLNDNFTLALRSFALPLNKNNVELVVLDYYGNVQAVVYELKSTPDVLIQMPSVLYVGSSTEFFALDLQKKEIVWKIDKPIEQRFSLHKGKLVSASIVLEPSTGTVLEKYPMGTNKEWKIWNDHFVTRVFDGDEYNDFLCEDSPRKYYYINYTDLEKLAPFEGISLTGNYPDETPGNTTAAIFKGKDGFYLVGLRMLLTN